MGSSPQTNKYNKRSAIYRISQSNCSTEQAVKEKAFFFDLQIGEGYLTIVTKG